MLTQFAEQIFLLPVLVMQIDAVLNLMQLSNGVHTWSLSIPVLEDSNRWWSHVFTSGLRRRSANRISSVVELLNKTTPLLSPLGFSLPESSNS
jgi:hypothetical protein